MCVLLCIYMCLSMSVYMCVVVYMYLYMCAYSVYIYTFFSLWIGEEGRLNFLVFTACIIPFPGAASGSSVLFLTNRMQQT